MKLFYLQILLCMLLNHIVDCTTRSWFSIHRVPQGSHHDASSTIVGFSVFYDAYSYWN